jgi:hypothetical protein
MKTMSDLFLRSEMFLLQAGTEQVAQSQRVSRNYAEIQVIILNFYRESANPIETKCALVWVPVASCKTRLYGK